MGFQYKIYEKIYTGTASGTIKLQIKYVNHTEWQPNELEFSIVGDIELEWGYEDDDQLTFYPAAAKIEIRDFTRRNYDILKFAVGSFTPYDGRNKFELNIFLNGRKEFSGYIDQLSLQWDERTRITTFNGLDWTALLSKINITPAEPENAGWNYMLDEVFTFFRGVQYNGLYYVYPNIQHPGNNPGCVTNNPETFKTMTSGYYFKHNWKFKADYPPSSPVIERSWDMNIDSDGWNHVGIFTGWIYSGVSTYADIIRAWALNTGTSIGAQTENKIYIFKRFVAMNEVSSIARRLDQSGDYKILDYQAYLHLSKAIGVRNITKRSSSILIEGDFPVSNGNDPGSSPLWGDQQLDIQTGIEQWIRDPIPWPPVPGEATIRCSQDSPFLISGCIKVQDPSIYSGWDIAADRLITKWMYQSRVRQRNRLELKLRGLNYYMHEFFLIYLPEVFGDLFRPMTIKWNLTQNITNMTAIEVSL